MNDELENANIKLDPESVKALEALVSELDDEVEGFAFKEAERPTLRGEMHLFIGSKPVAMPITFEPKGILSGDPRN